MPGGSRRSQSRQELHHGATRNSGHHERREHREHREPREPREPRERRHGSRTDLAEPGLRWPQAWASRLGIQLYGCCLEVTPCRPQERLVEKRAQSDRDRERPERRRSRRNRGGEDGRRQPRAEASAAGAEARGGARGRGPADSGSGGEDNGRGGGGCSGSSAGSDASRASRASRAPRRAGAAGGVRSRRSRAGEGTAGDEASVKVVNLADLRDRGLSPDALHRGRPAPEEAAEEGAQSARSGRSEGGRSARSCRSEGAKSEGGRSVASVSIRKYMGCMSEPQSPADVKKQVKDFVRQMVKGREMGVLRADGVLRPVLCGLTRSLDIFRIKSGTETRKVRLAEVDRVVHGNSDDLGDLATPLDESCATLELENAECISFKFAERKAAELFTLCMQLFIDGQK